MGQKIAFCPKIKTLFLVSQSQSLSVLESHIQLRVSEFLDIKMSFVLVRTWTKIGSNVSTEKVSVSSFKN